MRRIVQTFSEAPGSRGDQLHQCGKEKAYLCDGEGSATFCSQGRRDAPAAAEIEIEIELTGPELAVGALDCALRDVFARA